MSERIRQLIRDELQKVKGSKSIGREKAMIQCPFHKDNTPSCSINIDPQVKAPLGWTRCFGCKTSISWNDLAAKLGLRQINGQQSEKKEADDYDDPKVFEDELLGGDKLVSEDTWPELSKFEFFDFQHESWRDVPTAFLTKLGCKFLYDDNSGSRTEEGEWEAYGEFFVWMPVYVFGRLEGYIKARMEKEEGKTSYVNARGKWSASKGLLFFDPAVKLMQQRGLTTMILSEGPRDSIRSLMNRIPAVSVIGARNWGDEKRFLLEQAGVENIIIFMDGDQAGKDATELIYENTKDYFNVKFLNLWKYKKDYDPWNCPQTFIDKLKRSLI